MSADRRFIHVDGREVEIVRLFRVVQGPGAGGVAVVMKALGDGLLLAISDRPGGRLTVYELSPQH